jgi:carbonic anhydrase
MIRQQRFKGFPKMNQRTSTMQNLPELFAANARWSGGMRAVDPDFFAGLAALQSPSYLWIGCSDNRVPWRCMHAT